MSIIGKKLPEFTLDAFKKPELVKVSTADVLGKWSVFNFIDAWRSIGPCFVNIFRISGYGVNFAT